jgi:hypothetical protein
MILTTLWKLILGSVAIVCLGLFVGRYSQAADIYPSIAQLQAALNATPGTRLPPQVPQIIANGRVWTGYYVGAKDIGHGRYSVIIELR